MKEKAQELREAVNKAFPERLKLEFGCEVESLNANLILINKKVKYIIGEGWYPFWDCLFLGKSGKNMGVREIRETEKNFKKILGKPTSWGEVLRMLHPTNQISLRYGGLVINENTEDEIICDLTHLPEEQEPEVIDGLIKLLSKE